MRILLPSLLLASVVAATVVDTVVPPGDGCVLTADGICEEEEGAVNDDAEEQDAAVEEDIPPFEYIEGMSIVDVLNPDILADEDLLDEIRERFNDHDLVVLRDAFVPEFANYVVQDLARDDLDWPLWSEFADDGFSYSHHNFYDMEVRVVLCCVGLCRRWSNQENTVNRHALPPPCPNATSYAFHRPTHVS
jgi:hypothetical protein